MIRVRIRFLLVLVLSVACGAVLTPDRSVVLPTEQVQHVLRQCSRPTPAGVEATWDVPPDIVHKLEASLGRLTRLRARQCCLLFARVRDPDSYYRQYAGIVIGGRRLVYINAFRSVDGRDAWRDRAVWTCDGGDYYWGAVFDPETGKFSQLAFNGEA